MLQSQHWQNKGVNGCERGIVPDALLKLVVKDKLLHSRKVPVNAKEWQLRPLTCLRREKRGYSE